jgi:iron complex outermembrane receptor protein
MEGDGWSGNVGVRVVRTEGTSNGYQIVPNQVPGANLPAYPWGGFVQQTSIENNHTKVLPSVNLKLDVNKDVVARFGLSRTMSRPDFGALGGTVSLTDETHTGNGGNAKLQPVISNNIDATVQWYYAPRALGVGRPVLHGSARLRRLRRLHRHLHRQPCVGAVGQPGVRAVFDHVACQRPCQHQGR